MWWIKIATVCYFASGNILYQSTDTNKTKNNVCFHYATVSTSPIVAGAGETLYIGLKDSDHNYIKLWELETRENYKAQELKDAEERERRSLPYIQMDNIHGRSAPYRDRR